MIVPICQSNGIPQQISLAGDIPGEVRAGPAIPVAGGAALVEQRLLLLLGQLGRRDVLRG